MSPEPAKKERVKTFGEVKEGISKTCAELDRLKEKIDEFMRLPGVHKELKACIEKLAVTLYKAQNEVYSWKVKSETSSAFVEANAALMSDLQSFFIRSESTAVRSIPASKIRGAVEITEAIVNDKVPVAAPAPALASQEKKLDAILALANPSREDVLKVAETAMEEVLTCVRTLGFTGEAQTVVKKTSGAMLKLLGTRPNLNEILGTLKPQSKSYIASHSMMLAQVSTAMACAAGWTSPGTYLRLILGSFMHDLALKDDKLAMVRDPKDTILSKQEIEEVLQHPVRAAGLAKQIKEIPPDLDTLLLEHHERWDGKGFPGGLPHTKIHPLSCLFIIAHDFLDFMRENPEHRTFAQFIAEKGDQYDAGNFKKLIQQLKVGFGK